MALKDKWVDKIDGQDYVNSNDVNTIAQELIETQEELAQNPPVGEKGEDGATFIPYVSTAGVISWTNNKGLPNPSSVNIRGADGEDGKNGQDGVSITEIKQTVSSSADEGVNTFTVTLSNSTTANFNVKNGSKGSAGADGKSVHILSYDITGSIGNVPSIKKADYPEAKEDDIGIYFGEFERFCEKGTIGIIKNTESFPDELLLEPIGNIMGADGEDGVGIASIEQTTKSTADDGTNVITITLTDGTAQIFEVQNGSKGSQGIQGATGADGKDGKSIFVAHEISGRTTSTFLLERELYPEVKEGDIGIYVGEDEEYCEKGTVGIIEGVSIVQPNYLVFRPMVNIVGQQGNPGENGKTAFAYAQEGGYGGTEEEFGEKLAEVGKSQWQATFETQTATPIIAQQTITITDKSLNFTWANGVTLTVGEKYTVIWKGEAYVCTCYTDGEGLPALGDESLIFSTSGTYPFYISRQSYTQLFIYKQTRGSETIEFALLEGEDGVVYNTLPEEYLPQTLLAEIASLKARIEELESASTTAS